MKTQKKIKIWYIKNEEGIGYWSENEPDFVYDFNAMDHGEKFTIECEELTRKEYNALVKRSGEFEGW
jgi:hypothetical protein